MSATQKPTLTAIATREAPSHDASVLAEILSRVDNIEANQGRPSPIKLTTFEDIERFAEKAAGSDMVPEIYRRKPDAIVIAVMMGAELRLPPMQSLQNIAVISNRPSVWGDALPGLCRASGMMRTMREWSEGEGDKMVFHCEAVRKDDPQVITAKFSVSDALTAGLWSKAGPWKQYPKRMLQMRARGFCLRDAFPDVLKGLITAEEAEDIPFEERGLRARPEVEERPVEKKQTGAEWMAEIRKTLLEDDITAEEIDEIIQSAKVEKMQAWLTGAAKAELDDIVAKAVKRAQAMETTAPNDEATDRGAEEAP